MPRRSSKSGGGKVASPAVAALRLLCVLCYSSALSAFGQGVEIKTSDTSTDVARFRIETSGGVGTDANAHFLNARLGIGTSAPAAKLSVYDPDESATLTNFTQSLTDGGIQIVTDYTVNAYTPGLFWSTTDNNPTKPKAGIWLLEDGGGTRMFFGTSNSYVTGITNNGLILNASGYAGIGTTTPDAPLHVSAGTTSLLHLQSTTGGAGNAANVDFTTFAGAGLVGRIAAVDEGAWNGSLRFYTDGDGVANSNVTEKMRITPEGYTYLMNSDMYFTKTDHVHSGIGNAAGWAAIENSSNYNTLMLLGRAGVAGVGRWVRCWDRFDVNGWLVCNGQGNQYAAIITSHQGWYAQDWPAGWGGGLSTWDVCCSGVYYNVLSFRSDRRLKQNVESLGETLDRLQGLRPVSFDWKDPKVGGGGRNFGFIAQEVEEVMPELVSGSGDETRTLAQSEMTPLLVRAQQELAEALRKEDEAQRALEARILRLERVLRERRPPASAPAGN